MELIDFLKNIQNDVQTEIATRTEESDQQGLYAEVIFTEIVTQHMSEIGMTYTHSIYVSTERQSQLLIVGFASLFFIPSRKGNIFGGIFPSLVSFLYLYQVIQ